MHRKSLGERMCAMVCSRISCSLGRNAGTTTVTPTCPADPRSRQRDVHLRADKGVAPLELDRPLPIALPPRTTESSLTPEPSRHARNRDAYLKRAKCQR